MSDAPARWLLRLRRGAAEPRVRLFCLPPAGGGTSTFRDWRDELDAAVELVLVQLPGREMRVSEPPLRDLGELVERLARVLLPEISRPFALFGHSFGALIAFELARLFRRRGWGRPSHLFFSARRAPHVPSNGSRLATLPDARLIEAVQRRFGGIPPEIAANREWTSLILPALRADVGMDESYQLVPEPPLDCPTTILGGTSDRALPRRELEEWRRHAAGPFTIRELPGDHFFLRSGQSHREVLRTLAVALLGGT